MVQLRASFIRQGLAAGAEAGPSEIDFAAIHGGA
jgi:hypothetical protein